LLDQTRVVAIVCEEPIGVHAMRCPRDATHVRGRGSERVSPRYAVIVTDVTGGVLQS
jgi:hypothetical protein